MGHVGKGNHRVNVKWPTLLLIGLAGCANTTNGLYLGLVSTQQGVCGPNDGNQAGTRASLTLRGKDVQFQPDNGVIVLEGHLDSAGHMLAQSNAPGADHKPFAQVFEGDLVGHRIVGRFATPRCRATVSLARQ